MAGTGGDHVTVEQDSKAIITGLESHNQRGYRQAADILSRDSQNPNTFRQIMAKVHDGIKNDPKAMKELHHLELVDGSAEPHAKLKHDKEPGRKPPRSERTGIGERTTGEREERTEPLPQGDAPDAAQQKDLREKSVGDKLGLTPAETQRAQDMRDGKEPNPPLTKDEQDRLDKYTKDHHGQKPHSLEQFMSALYDGTPTPGRDEPLRDVSPKAIQQAKAAERLDRATNDVDDAQKTPGLRKGEGYYQALQRMHKDWSPERLLAEAHRLKAANGGRTNLRVGERFDTMTPDEREQAISDRNSTLEKQDTQNARTDVHDKAVKEFKQDPAKNDVPSAAKLAGLDNDQEDEFNKAQKEAQDKGQKYTLADYLKEKGLSDNPEVDAAKAFKEQDQLYKLQRKTQGDAPDAKEQAANERGDRHDRSSAAVDQFHQDMDKGPDKATVPSVPELMGLKPDQIDDIKKAQDDGDPRSVEEIAKARGLVSEREIDAARQVKKTLQNEQDAAFRDKSKTDHATDPNNVKVRTQAGEHARAEFEEKFKKDPNTPPPSQEELLGLNEDQTASIEAARKAGDTRSPAEIALARGLITVDEYKRVNKEEGQIHQEERAAVRNQAVADFKADPTKELPSPYKLLGLNDDQIAEYKAKNGADPSYNMNKYLQEKFGLTEAEAKAQIEGVKGDYQALKSLKSSNITDNQKKAVPDALLDLAKDPSKLPSAESLSGLPPSVVKQIHDYQRKMKASGQDPGDFLKIAEDNNLLSKDQADFARAYVKALAELPKHLPPRWAQMKPQEKIDWLSSQLQPDQRGS